MSHYDGPGHGTDEPDALRLSPDGRTVYTAAISWGGSDYDIAVLAYDTSTGEQLWESRFPGLPGWPEAGPGALSVDPSTGRLFVTGSVGESLEPGAPVQGVTVAYDADGEQLWTRSITADPLARTGVIASAGPGNAVPAAGAYGSGEVVYVAGVAAVRESGASVATRAVTIAYDAATGDTLWQRVHAGPQGDPLFGMQIAVSPDGRTVYTGAAKTVPFGPDQGMTEDLTVLAYRAAPDPAVTGATAGSLAWEGHHPVLGFLPTGIAVAPDGSQVYVTQTDFSTEVTRALTIAYDASDEGPATRAVRWATIYQAPGEGFWTTSWYWQPIAAAPDGSRVFVTARVIREGTPWQEGTVALALDPATGEKLWATLDVPLSRYSCACGPVITVNSNSDRVYTAYLVGDMLRPYTVTASYDAANGARLWRAAYSFSPQRGGEFATGIVTAHDGSRVFVTARGDDKLADTGEDVVVLAYDTGGS